MAALERSSFLMNRDGSGAQWLHRTMAFLLTLAAFLLFSHLIIGPHSPDERGYLAWGMRICKEGAYETPDGRPVTRVPPLHPHLLGLAFRFLGPTVASAQCMSVVFGALCVGIIYALGESLFNWRVGLLAALFLMTSARGEFWRYSNRVLNDIHLTFFVLLTLYLLCLHWRHGKWWVGAGAGISLGLGLLTKELAVLVLPLFIPAFLFRQDPLGKKLVALFISLSLAASLILPWALHVKSVTGSPLGGIAQRGKGKALGVISDQESWGLRDGKTIWKTIHFRGMTSGLFRVLYTFALLYVAYRCWRRREREHWLIILFVLIWFTTYLTCLKLPLTRRQLIPLIPTYSLFVSVLLDDLYSIASRFWSQRNWVRYGRWGFLLTLLAINLSPRPWFLEIRPLAILRSPIPLFLYEEAQQAIACIMPGARIISNYPNLLYFYGKGEFQVFKSKWIPREGGAGEIRKRAQIGYEGKGSPIVIGEEMKMHSFMSVVRHFRVSHVVIFRPEKGNRLQGLIERSGQQGFLRAEVLCQGEGVRVYRIVSSSYTGQAQCSEPGLPIDDQTAG